MRRGGSKLLNPVRVESPLSILQPGLRASHSASSSGKSRLLAYWFPATGAGESEDVHPAGFLALRACSVLVLFHFLLPLPAARTPALPDCWRALRLRVFRRRVEVFVRIV